jgi:type IV secretory pathway protease TraF
MLVVLPVPAVLRPWWSSGLPLLKPVAGVSGDTVCSLDLRLVVQGQDLGPIYPAWNAQPLPHIAEGCQVVPDGAVFLASAMAQSLDSRYFGLVLVQDITAQAMPLLTWR